MGSVATVRCRCGKVGYYSRALARKGARQQGLHGLNAYRCSYVTNEMWHLGHLPVAIKKGRLGRETAAQAIRTPQRRPE